MEKILIHSNDTDISKKAEVIIRQKLIEAGYMIADDFSEDLKLIICIGGDGSFLTAVHQYGFPHIPFVGVNTGHLGFFQELSLEDIDDFIRNYQDGKFVEQHLSTVRAYVNDREYTALNEILLKSADTKTVHLDISIGGKYIEKFSGDGILIASSAGSTGYNYSLRGAIVDPRVNLLQLTPLAPMNTIAYRSFTSPLILPPDIEIKIRPEKPERLIMSADGFQDEENGFSGDSTAEEITIISGKRYVNLLRFEGYDFWGKVKTKFI